MKTFVEFYSGPITTAACRQELTDILSKLGTLGSHPKKDKIKKAEKLVDEARSVLFSVEDQKWSPSK